MIQRRLWILVMMATCSLAKGGIQHIQDEISDDLYNARKQELSKSWTKAEGTLHKNGDEWQLIVYSIGSLLYTDPAQLSHLTYSILNASSMLDDSKRSRFSTQPDDAQQEGFLKEGKNVTLDFLLTSAEPCQFTTRLRNLCRNCLVHKRNNVCVTGILKKIISDAHVGESSNG